LPVNNYSSTITVKDVGGKTEVEWKGAFYRGFMNNDRRRSFPTKPR